jgi:CRISPR/Cas system-associated exonuclease Cas4 (RecB family)
MHRPRYNQSELKAFLKCGKLWEFRYLRGIKQAPNAALTVGSSVDSAVTANLAQKVVSGTDLSKEEVLDRFSDDFDARKAETEWGECAPGDQKDMGAKLVALHHETVAPKILPETVQESFLLELEGEYDLHGTIDHVEKDGTVVDTKTSRLKYEPDAIAGSLQPAMYDFAYEATRGRPAKGFRYDVLVKPTQTRGPAFQQVEGKVTNEDREWLFDTINQVHKAIQAGIAMPAPEGSWYCNRKWCGYWDRCKGRKSA